MADRTKEKRSSTKALTSYEAEAELVRAKTARLRELRLARDAARAADAKPAPVKAVASKKKQPGKTAGKGQSLAEWLATEESQGRRS